MTSAASQSSDVSSRRLRMLAALDIDVWATRSAAQPDVQASNVTPASTSGNPSVSSPIAAPQASIGGVSSTAAAPARRSGAGPAAALALLEQSAKAGSAWETSSSNSDDVGAAAAKETPVAESAAPVVVEPVDIWCLSGSHGVLLAQHEGISPQAQRLLNDILQAATRVIAGRLKSAAAEDSASVRIKLQALRFTWPPTDQAGSDMAGQDTARALRGFLNRQLKNADEPVLLYVAGDLKEVLERVDLAIDASRQVALDEPELLMSDSTAKRALWRTLSAL